MPDTSHPENTCEECGGPNVIWFVANHVWNEVVDNIGTILCPVCFVRRADAVLGDEVVAWEMVPQYRGG